MALGPLSAAKGALLTLDWLGRFVEPRSNLQTYKLIHNGCQHDQHCGDVDMHESCTCIAMLRGVFVQRDLNLHMDHALPH